MWSRAPILVQDHDFRSQAQGLAIPYGIYDLQANRGMVVVGTSHDTPLFAVEALCQWWRREGCERYAIIRPEPQSGTRSSIASLAR